jgi:hypothetical protein
MAGRWCKVNLFGAKRGLTWVLRGFLLATHAEERLPGPAPTQNRRLQSEWGKVSPKKEGGRRLRGGRWKPRVLARPTEKSHPLHG